jgi:hypothetical protein
MWTGEVIAVRHGDSLKNTLLCTLSGLGPEAPGPTKFLNKLVTPHLTFLGSRRLGLFLFFHPRSHEESHYRNGSFCSPASKVRPGLGMNELAKTFAVLGLLFPFIMV